MTAQAATTNSGPGYASHPGYRIDFEPCAKRLRIAFGGETVADSTAVRLLHETKHIPVYYVPRADVRMDLLERTDHSTFCPFKARPAITRWPPAIAGRKTPCGPTRRRSTRWPR